MDARSYRPRAPASPAAQALQLQRGAEHLYRLGPRAVAEFLAEIAEQRADLPAIIELLGEYRERLSPEMLRLVGGDRFPRRVPLAVPG